jgi:hypothetical protein
MSALPAARSTLLGCQSTASTVDLIGFFRSFDTHQLFSESKEQIAIALISTVQYLSDKQFTQELPRAARYSKFIFLGAPSDMSGSSIDPE